jgi:hypothetical protein
MKGKFSAIWYLDLTLGAREPAHGARNRVSMSFADRNEKFTKKPGFWDLGAIAN